MLVLIGRVLLVIYYKMIYIIKERGIMMELKKNSRIEKKKKFITRETS